MSIEERLAAIEEQQSLLLERIDKLLQQQEPPKPLKTEAAAEYFGVHPDTLSRWKREQPWIKGCHWWKTGRSVYYNVALITDGQINGFKSADHIRAVEQFRKSLPSQKRK